MSTITQEPPQPVKDRLLANQQPTVLAYTGWVKVIGYLTAAIAAEPRADVRAHLERDRLDALAEKDQAWIAKEAHRCSR